MQRFSFLLDPQLATIAGQPRVERYLEDLEGIFASPLAHQQAIRAGNPLVYSVSSVEAANQAGDLHFGLGRIEPGRVGAEYFMTRGHLHTWREAAEIYVGLQGRGLMLLEDEDGQRLWSEPLQANQVVYVPGGVAHRTVNIGTTPLVYLGIYPARAGHDYQSIAERNFAQVAVEINGQPTVLLRHDWLSLQEV